MGDKRLADKPRWVTYTVQFTVLTDPDKDSLGYDNELEKIEKDLSTVGAKNIQLEDEGEDGSES